MAKGVLCGVSVGPGDPDLMTLAAVKAIKRCPVVAAPRTKGENTLALDIARASVDMSGKEICLLDFKMAKFHGDRDAVHAGLADQLCAHLDAGRDVAMLNLGDATLYATWSHIERIVRGRGYGTETIPGVNSFCASAAKLHTSLTKMHLPLHIIPAKSSQNMEEVLQLPGTKVIMKSGRALPDVKDALERLDMADKASMVVNCGLPGERVLDHVEANGDEGYFVTVLVGD